MTDYRFSKKLTVHQLGEESIVSGTLDQMSNSILFNLTTSENAQTYRVKKFTKQQTRIETVQPVKVPLLRCFSSNSLDQVLLKNSAVNCEMFYETPDCSYLELIMDRLEGNSNNVARDPIEVADDAEILDAVKKNKVSGISRLATPRPKLTDVELCSEKGIQELENMFRGSTYDYKNLTLMMGKIEYWAHLLCPSLNFHDFISRVETVGEKRMIQTRMNELRLKSQRHNDDDSEKVIFGNEHAMLSEEPFSPNNDEQIPPDNGEDSARINPYNHYEHLCSHKERENLSEATLNTPTELETGPEYVDDTEALDFIFATN
uniref:TIMELESS-interacting protein n=1 Tax=Syphacia muris TaxID=451379 RepID=A0A0N5AQK3_9BILA